MGQFTSECPQCAKPIHWFLNLPQNYMCKCGCKVSPEQIQESYHKLEDARMREMYVKMAATRAKEEQHQEDLVYLEEIKKSWLPGMKKYRAMSEDTEVLLRLLDYANEQIAKYAQDQEHLIELLHIEMGNET